MGNRLVSKAMDDRISVAVQIEALKQLKETPHEVYFVFQRAGRSRFARATTAAFGVDRRLASRWT
jgi:endoglucanase